MQDSPRRERGTAISIAAIVAAVGLVLLAAALVGNARIRRRRAASAVSVDALLATRLAGSRAGEADVWAGVQVALTRSSRAGAGADTLAGRLEVLCDRSESRPKLADDIELKEFHLRWGNDYALIANPRELLHYRLEPGEVEILPLLDGRKTVKEIVVDRLQDSGDFELGGVADLVQQLKVGGFLDTPFLDVDAAVARAIAPESTIGSKITKFVKTLSVEWSGADKLVRWIHDHVLFWIFPLPVVALFALVAGSGLIAFLDVYFSRRFSFSGAAIAAASLILIALDWVLTFCHELGHAIVLVHQGRRVKSAGFMIYFGAPAFFVESSDGLMVDPHKRIRQSFAGPFAELIIAGVASLYVWGFPGAPGAAVLYKFAVLNYFVVLLNLVPLLELDGYYILSDLIQVPDLRQRSLSFMRDDVPRKIRDWDGLTKQEVGLGVYGVMGVAFTIFCLWTSVFFWREVFGGLVSDLWNGGLWTRLLLLVLGVFLLGPILRGLISLARAAFARARALWRRITFRLQTSWRVEAAELIDALPTFDDLPEDVLSDLAGRVQLRTFPEGKPVVRQGERARGFYVVRHGTLQVVEELPGGGNEPCGYWDEGSRSGNSGWSGRRRVRRPCGRSSAARSSRSTKGPSTTCCRSRSICPSSARPCRLPWSSASSRRSTTWNSTSSRRCSSTDRGAHSRRERSSSSRDRWATRSTRSVRERSTSSATATSSGPWGRASISARSRCCSRCLAPRVSLPGLRGASSSSSARASIAWSARRSRAGRSSRIRGRTGPRPTRLRTADKGARMDCWHCRKTAVGTCRFCGRGVCEDHAETKPYVLELFRSKGVRRALVVEDALFCGACTPRPDPVDLPELD